MDDDPYWKIQHRMGDSMNDEHDDDLGMWRGLALAALLGMLLWFLFVALLLILLVD